MGGTQSIAFVLCFSKGSVQQHDYKITTLYFYRLEVFTKARSYKSEFPTAFKM